MKAPRIRIGLVGLGLIGGSIARALRRDGADLGGVRRPIVTAWSPSGSGPVAALRAGVVDEVAHDLGGAVADADLVVITAPPLATLELVDWLAGPLRELVGPATTITDVASTKRTIVERARTLGLPFAGGHPMAGLETSGFAAATGGLFEGRPWVVVDEGAREIDVARVEWLATACGALPVRLGAGDHDAAVAAVSHLPLVAAVALAESVLGGGARDPDPAVELARRLAAGGWASATRVGRGDPVMGAGILATNAREIAPRLRAYRDALDSWLAALEAGDAPDAAALEARLRAARERLG
ncbi:MAG: hypothetical protein RL338_805 [Chloroflexota bacterium]|jgi:prephenate dehydrogenase